MCIESIKSPSLCLLVKTCLKGAFIYIYMRDCAALGHTRATKPGEEEQSDSGFYTMWTSLEEEKQAYIEFSSFKQGKKNNIDLKLQPMNTNPSHYKLHFLQF